ncbi:MAG: tRNA (N6-threonylcarbamoyladenosine(37)-N6)-methyltransferase TrmO [Promethearchaeota archaeon]
MEIEKKELINLKDRKFPEEIILKPIGIIHTPFQGIKGIPIQPSMSDSKGSIEIFPEFAPALKDLEGFQYIYCIYYFDLVKLPVPLQSKPFLVNEKKGVFAIRTPFRPNPIGLSVLEIISINKDIININNVDILDQTPVLDIKPYVPDFDHRETKQIGWLKGNIKDHKS